MGRSVEVDTWLNEYESPMNDVVRAVREITLEDERITETITWKSSTFMYQGNMASFNPRSKKHASLLFHTGASIPGDHRRLAGGGETARYMTFADLDEVAAAADDLRGVVAAWCDSRS